MDHITLNDEDSIEISHVAGVIHLRVNDGDGYAFVAIKPHHFDAIEARWGDARAHLDVYRAQRAERAAVWLEERGHRTVRDLVNAGHVDVEGVLAFAARHAAAIERHRSSTPPAAPPVEGRPDWELTSSQCEGREIREHQECDNDGCGCECHTPDDEPCCADPECGRR